MGKRVAHLSTIGILFLIMALSGCGGSGGGYTGPTYSLSGTILRATDNSPMEGVVLHFGSEFGTSSTGPDGNWSMSGLHGTVTVTPVMAGWSFIPASQDVTDETSGISMNGTAITGGVNIIFLHHSTGTNVWGGGVPEWFDNYNTTNGTHYTVNEAWFETESGGNNPYDYWKLWVHDHTGTHSLETLTPTYNVIIWKHCFPVSNVGSDPENQSVSSSDQTIENYKLQYAALKTKMNAYPNVKFIVWTGAAQVQNAVSHDDAVRAQDFFNWVKTIWDVPGDNVYVWDFYSLETEGSLYMKSSYASSSSDSILIVVSVPPLLLISATELST